MTNQTASIRRYWDIHLKNALCLFFCVDFEAKPVCPLVVQVPNDLLEQAKAAAQAALEEMDAD